MISLCHINCHYECIPEHDGVPECFSLIGCLTSVANLWLHGIIFNVCRLTEPSAVNLFCESHVCVISVMRIAAFR